VTLRLVIRASYTRAIQSFEPARTTAKFYMQK